ncbi:MAG: hypothetical protein ACOYYS_07205 [Chloroflexota bacterium]
MNIFGVGPFEFILFLLIALLILGPERMISSSRSIARFIRNLLTSPTWRTVQSVQTEMRNIPTQLLREAGLEKPEDLLPTAEEIAKEAGLDELSRQVSQVQQQVKGEWREMGQAVANTPALKAASTAKAPPVSPPDSGIPTISAPPAPPAPDGPPTLKSD